MTLSCSNVDVVSKLQTPIVSPDGNLMMLFYHKEDSQGRTSLSYRICYKKNPIILDSQLEILLDNHLSEMALGLEPQRRQHFSW